MCVLHFLRVLERQREREILVVFVYKRGQMLSIGFFGKQCFYYKNIGQNLRKLDFERSFKIKTIPM